MTKISVIIPAAGAGKRFGGMQNKIFEKIAGREVFLRTIDAFASRGDVGEILLVVSPTDLSRVQAEYAECLKKLRTKIVVGGATRSQSVRNAIAALSADAELVAVHDAVRPCVSQRWLDAVFAKAGETGAAMLALPLTGTIKKSAADGMICDTIPRDGLWEAQTPQVFRRDIFARAYQADTDATDDSHLVQQLGVKVALVRGDPRNVKITTAEDLAFAQAVFGTIA